MPTVRERVTAAGVGAGLLVAGLALVLLGYLLFPLDVAGWTAVGAGLLVVLGLTAALASIFLFLLPAILPTK